MTEPTDNVSRTAPGSASHSILVFNAGSSSLKVAVFDMETGHRVVHGIADGLSSSHGPSGSAQLRWSLGDEPRTVNVPDPSHEGALATVVGLLREHADVWSAISAVGHRVVHGGESFRTPVPVDHGVLQRIEQLQPLAPLHNPVNLMGIRAAQAALPDRPHVAVFDTAFHQTLPPRAFHYAVPRRLYRELGVRRYGFHGTSHAYVSREAIRRLGLDLPSSALVTAHLGNGCSVTAVQAGRSVDTSMGLSPLEGLVMGTRSGDVDPGLHAYLARELDLDIGAIDAILNRESGLLGLSEKTHDMRTLWEDAEQGDESAALAVEVFCYRLAKMISGLVVPLGHLDALVFTGGIGENSAGVRGRVLGRLSHLGLHVDERRNAQHGEDADGVISGDSAPRAMVIPTDEEWLIARETLGCLHPESRGAERGRLGDR